MIPSLPLSSMSSFLDYSFVLTFFLSLLAAVGFVAFYSTQEQANRRKNNINNGRKQETQLAPTPDPHPLSSPHSIPGLSFPSDFLGLPVAAYEQSAPIKERDRMAKQRAQHRNTATHHHQQQHAHLPPVYILLTTLPSRVHHIDKCLASLKQQNYPIEKILIAIPEESRREGSKYSLPERILRDSHIRVIRASTDYGPATRLIAGVAWLRGDAKEPVDEDAMLVTVDDDYIYHPDMVGLLVGHSLFHPSAALGLAGCALVRDAATPTMAWVKRADERAFNGLPSTTNAVSGPSSSSAFSSSIDPSSFSYFDYDPYGPQNLLEHFPCEPCDVLNGWRGVLYRLKFFTSPSFLHDFLQFPSFVQCCDDEAISFYLASLGVPRLLILSPCEIIMGKIKLKHGRSSHPLQALRQRDALKFLDTFYRSQRADAADALKEANKREGEENKKFTLMPEEMGESK